MARWEDPIGPHALKEKICHAGQSFRLSCLTGKVTGGLKTPGYSKTVLRTGRHRHANFMLGRCMQIMRWADGVADKGRRRCDSIGHAGQSFRLTCLSDKTTEGLPPGYSKNVLRTGLHRHANFTLIASTVQPLHRPINLTLQQLRPLL